MCARKSGDICANTACTIYNKKEEPVKAPQRYVISKSCFYVPVRADYSQVCYLQRNQIDGGGHRTGDLFGCVSILIDVAKDFIAVHQDFCCYDIGFIFRFGFHVVEHELMNRGRIFYCSLWQSSRHRSEIYKLLRWHLRLIRRQRTYRSLH